MRRTSRNYIVLCSEHSSVRALTSLETRLIFYNHTAMTRSRALNENRKNSYSLRLEQASTTQTSQRPLETLAAALAPSQRPPMAALLAVDDYCCCSLWC